MTNHPKTAVWAFLIAAIATVAAPRPTAAQSPCGGFYTIQNGDSLADIAVSCGVTVPALLARNPAVRDDQDLRAGARIAIPAQDAPQPGPVEACGGFYTIRSGDSLREIAAKCGLPIPVLLAANPGVRLPLQLQAGASLRIPNLPRQVLDSGSITVIAGDADFDSAAADIAAVEADSTEQAAPALELLRHTGRLDRSNPACPRVRTADGAVGLLGEINRMFTDGEVIAVMGEAVESDACGDLPVVRARIVWRPKRG